MEERDETRKTCFVNSKNLPFWFSETRPPLELLPCAASITGPSCHM